MTRCKTLIGQFVMGMTLIQQRDYLICRVHNCVLVSSKLFVHPNRQLLARAHTHTHTHAHTHKYIYIYLFICIYIYCVCVCACRPPLWSSDQSFWLQIQRSRVRSPALPDFLSSSGSGTGSTQPREVI